MFIVPPYFKGFRIFSERGIVGDWKDGTLSNFNPQFAFDWWQRMKNLGYGKNNYKNYKKAKIYNNLTEEDFARLSKKYGATYIIVEKPKKLRYPLVYENKKIQSIQG